MIEQIVRCDYCKEIKKESNHWWQLRCFPSPSHMDDAVFKTYEVSLMVSSGYLETEESMVLHLCSESCLMHVESRIRQGLDPRLGLRRIKENL